MKKWIVYIIIFLLIPIVILSDVFIFNSKQYDIIGVIVAVLSILPFFISFEERKPVAREIVFIATITAVVVASRILFAFTPSFKPVSAIVIIVGLAFGKETGFMVGSLAALLSNIYFGQGPWTLFQMLAWGLIGFISGLFMKTSFMKKPVSLIIWGIISGFLFSLIMDFQTMLVIDNAINLKRFLVISLASLEITIIYAVSNVIFLLILTKPLLKKFDRIKIKYEIYDSLVK